MKCRFCGESLDKLGLRRQKWYFSTPFIVIAILSVGPFALPFVWRHPRYSIACKSIVTMLTFVLAIAAYLSISALLEELRDRLNEMFQLPR